MNYKAEWEKLRTLLRHCEYQSDNLDNLFFQRLLIVLRDETSQSGDKLLAYRDALCASPSPDSSELQINVQDDVIQGNASKFGLRVNRHGGVSLAQSNMLADVDLSAIYSLAKRRYIKRTWMDPVLQLQLQNPDYSFYNGTAQQMAVRLAVTAERNSTIIVNLPTGCGKTLIAHALCLNSSSNSLILVIVPTISLAIEQGIRASQFLEKSGLGHGGLHFWHGGQTREVHKEIRERIRTQQQRLLFCAPESACRSLLPILFEASRNGSLSDVIVDEAHIVDQWGTEFRPYFQILSSMLQALRDASPRSIKSVLMSATFTSKSIDLVKGLFGTEDKPCIEINGCFLRPETQYHVQKVTENEHLDKVCEAVVALPKPMIIYVLYPSDAERIKRRLRGMGVSRSGLFTGDTMTDRRETLIESWRNQKIDIMVATSAFGLGIDKNDVRSVVHAAIPENLDRFYQETGRGGRDGLACQSLIVYHRAQENDARKLNMDRRITVDLGLKKWLAMWGNGKEVEGGKKEVSIRTLRRDQAGFTQRNEEWNWRTLLLMQRAGLIKIELPAPSPPWFDAIEEEDYRKKLKDYYDKYYKKVVISPLHNEHKEKTTWEHATANRREFEERESKKGVERLISWLRNPKAHHLCDLLLEHYTLENDVPEYACGGCPGCRQNDRGYESSTLGGKAIFNGIDLPTTWKPPMQDCKIRHYVYFPDMTNSQKRFLRENICRELARLIDLGTVLSVCSDKKTLATLGELLPSQTSSFWMADIIDESAEEPSMWPQLVLHLDAHRPIPNLGWSESPKLFMAPEGLDSNNHFHRKWWQDKKGSVSLEKFFEKINYVNVQ